MRSKSQLILVLGLLMVLIGSAAAAKKDARIQALPIVYQEWLEEPPPGQARRSKAGALQRAKLWLRDYRDEDGDRPYAHPYYWSAFVLVGRPD